jgi:hypothetical protein
MNKEKIDKNIMRRAAGGTPRANGRTVKNFYFRVGGPMQTNVRDHFGSLICVASLEML